MPAFDVDEHTPRIRIWERYPWLSERMPQIDRRFAVMNTAMGKLLMKKNTVADLSRISGLSSQELLEGLRREIAQREGQDAGE